MSVGLVLLDQYGCIEMMNPAAERITGLRFEDADGRSLHETVHSLHEDGTVFNRADCPIDRAARELRELSGYEDVFVRPDGSFYNVVCNMAPLFKDGQRLGCSRIIHGQAAPQGKQRRSRLAIDMNVASRARGRGDDAVVHLVIGRKRRDVDECALPCAVAGKNLDEDNIVIDGERRDGSAIGPYQIILAPTFAVALKGEV